ncbi:MAG: CerR family C-terminal domain-containing protein [Oxalicibacterium faecigallinarum]|uniref:TetR/AcrR family transcriptional regulator n=1 Tax=Oxalicibacterium faecigallinarum TaxID=573741 RepID=UPI002808DB94|nr:CerR family C-terminal domain-containing protein [Oxalicibacterium faecigallinarum]MDQ7968255.1 CerR family C-terminal domain-containing protein [Oxalicibacterium faecigallinarum]
MNAAKKTSPSLTPDDSVPEADQRRQRADGAEARQRLLHAALRLFAEKGFSKTSTRDIAQTAGVNVASIKYYFGDKDGLYRAAFAESMGPECNSWSEGHDVHALSLRDALMVFYKEFLAPLKQSETTQLGILLHFREVLEPTGMWQEEIDRQIKPSHAALVQLLLKHVQVEQEDDEIHRLAFSIAGLAMQVYINDDILRAIRPSLIARDDELERWTTQLTGYAEAMVLAAAAQRRKLASQSEQQQK